jgi:hypothetical protein
MQIQVNSDNSVAVDSELTQILEANISHTLQRFGERLTRVEVHLSDVNGGKFGTADKRCLLEARPSGRDPVTVTNDAATPELAVKGAAQKMERLLTSTFARVGDRT